MKHWRNLWKLWSLLAGFEGTRQQGWVGHKVGEMFGVNKWVRVKDYEVCIMGVEDLRVARFRLSFDAPIYKAPNPVDDLGSQGDNVPAEDWPRVLFVDVAYRNTTTNKTLDCRSNQWFLFDADGYSYEPQGSNQFLYDNNNKPYLGGSRFLNPGMKARGWLAFELKLNIVPERMQFVDGFISGNTADFRLPTPSNPMLPAPSKLLGPGSE
jgi:hypothetical protein